MHIQNSISKEKAKANSNHSTNQVIVTESVHIRMTNSHVVQPQTMNDSSISNVQIKDKAQECQNISFVATVDDAKMHIQKQSNVTISELPKITYHKMQRYSTKKGNDHSGPSTFLSQHSKVIPTKFTIPAIYITDVDSTPQNRTHCRCC